MMASLRTRAIGGGCEAAGVEIGNSGCSGTGTTAKCARSLPSTSSGSGSVMGGMSGSGIGCASSEVRMLEMRCSTSVASSVNFAALMASTLASSSACIALISTSSERSSRLTVSDCPAAVPGRSDCSLSIAASNFSPSAFRFRLAYSARKSRPRALAASAP